MNKLAVLMNLQQPFVTTKKIGILDSGIGGISILQKLLPISGFEFIYVADTAHIPYGKRTQHEIQLLTQASVQFLVAQEVELIIIACHTASTNALPYVRKRFSHIVFIDVVDLVIQQALITTQSDRIGIIATKATITSKVHEKKLMELNKSLKVFSQACPLLASTIEKNFDNSNKIFTITARYLKPLLRNHIDTLLIGCTHYAHIPIQEIIKKISGDQIQLVSAEQTIVDKIKPFILSESQISSTVQWFVTGNREQFKKTISSILKNSLYDIKKV